jgi:tellurite resistance protein
MNSTLSQKAHNLEEAFFQKRDAELLAEWHRQEQQRARLTALRDASGCSDDHVLKQLLELDISPDTLTAFTLLPVVEVAWADGDIDERERHAILQALKNDGVPENSTPYKLVEDWLVEKPDAKLHAVWRAYLRALLQKLDREAVGSLEKTVLDRAARVAESAGGFLGFGRISDSEQEVLNELRRAFEPPARGN